MYIVSKVQRGGFASRRHFLKSGWHPVFHQHSFQTNTNHNSWTSTKVPVPRHIANTQNHAHTVKTTGRQTFNNHRRLPISSLMRNTSNNLIGIPHNNTTSQQIAVGGNIIQCLRHRSIYHHGAQTGQQQLTGNGNDNLRQQSPPPLRTMLNSPPRETLNHTTTLQARPLSGTTRTTSQAVTWHDVATLPWIRVPYARKWHYVTTEVPMRKRFYYTNV